MIKLHAPRNNLGCAGITIGEFYADVYKHPYVGCFISIPRLAKIWLNFSSIRWEGAIFFQLRLMRYSTAKRWRIERFYFKDWRK